jgi:hypothetical protein
MDTGILSWLNEASLTPYPLQHGFGCDGFLLDANFVQFDNFVPILTSLSLNELNLSINLQIDVGAIALSIPVGELTGSVLMKTLYDSSGRYVGCLTFGYDILGPFDRQSVQTVDVNIPFLPHLVKSIPLKAGVYAIDGVYGPVIIHKDDNIFFDFIGLNNEIVFNAIAVPQATAIPYLKTLNSIEPMNNSVYMQDTEILKITSPSTATIQFSIIGSNLDDVLKQLGNTIITNKTP